MESRGRRAPDLAAANRPWRKAGRGIAKECHRSAEATEAPGKASAERLQQLRNRLSCNRIDHLGSDLYEWLQHERSFAKPWMGDDQSDLVDDLIGEQNEVEVQR